MLLAWVKEDKEESVTLHSFGMKINPQQSTIKNVIKSEQYRNNIFDKRYVAPDLDAVCTTIPFRARHSRFADLM